MISRTRHRALRRRVTVLAALALVLLWAGASLALAPSGVASHATGIHLDLDPAHLNYVTGIRIMLLLAALALAPTIVLSMTSFTRIIVVLALLRQAVGVTQLPPNRVLVGLALFLTLFTMMPVLHQIDRQALTPYEAGQIGDKQALTRAMHPMREFMLHHTHESDLALFLHIMHAPKPNTAADVPIVAIVPAFMLSELKTAFEIGALLFIPFLVIDLVVASILMSMGMMMLPPLTISLPLKIIVFVLVDGWGLVVTSLAKSFMR